MKKIDLTRAWKDPYYRSTLNSNELASLPENPAGLMEVTDDDLKAVSGGTSAACTVVIAATIAIIAITVLAGCAPQPKGR